MQHPSLHSPLHKQNSLFTSGNYAHCTLQTPFCCWTLRNWAFNTLLAGTFAALVACIQHWIINLLRALKCHNTGILLFAACPLFISCRSYLRQNGRWQTFAVFRKPLRGKELVSISEFLVYKRSKMNHDPRYCGWESITWQITLQGRKTLLQVIRM